MSQHYARLALAASRARYLLSETHLTATNHHLFELFSALHEYVLAHPTARQTDRPFFATALAALRLFARVQRERVENTDFEDLVHPWSAPLDPDASEAAMFDLCNEFPAEQDMVDVGENGYALVFPRQRSMDISLPSITTLVPNPLPIVTSARPSRMETFHSPLAKAVRGASRLSHYVRGSISVTEPGLLPLFAALSDVLGRYPDALHFDETVTSSALAATVILDRVRQPPSSMVEESRIWRLPLNLRLEASNLFTLEKISFPRTLKRRARPRENGYAVWFPVDKGAGHFAPPYSPPAVAPAPAPVPIGPSGLRMVVEIPARPRRRVRTPLFLPDSDSERERTPLADRTSKHS